MAFQLSPGINVSEIDLTNAVPAVGTSEGAFVGTFRWGPTNERVLITSEKELASVFGKPYNSSGWSNQQSFFSAANFLGYSNALYVTRTDDATALVATGTNFDARYRGELGNSIKVISCDSSATGFTDSTSAHIAQSELVIGRGDAFADIKGPATSDGTALSFNPSINSHVNFGSTANGATASIATIEAASADQATNQLETDAAHGFATGDKIALTLSGAFAPFAAQDYFVRVIDTDSITLHPTEADALADSNVVAFDASQVSAASGGMTFTRAAVAPNTFFIAGHGLSNGDDIRYETDTDQTTGEIGNLDNDVTYFVTNATTDTFQVASTAINAANGSAIDIFFDSGTTPQTHTFTPLASDTVVGGEGITHFNVGDYIVIGDNVKLQISSIGDYTDSTNTLRVNFSKKYWGSSSPQGSGFTFKLQWEGSDIFDKKPDTGRFHAAVIDEDGEISGTAGEVLETFANLSTTEGTKNFDGSSAYTGIVLDEEDGTSGFIKIKSGATFTGRQTTSLTGGSDGYTETSSDTLGDILEGWDLYISPDEVDVSLLITGASNSVVQNYVMDNIAEVRKDCVAFVSPDLTDVTAQDIVDYADGLSGSSYSVIDTGYKYQYDKYNDKYCWIPLNADVAGTCARTDGERDPWFSPAGYNRGQLKNVIKLKINPNKAQRDLLYKNNVNPVIIEPGSGAILFGDKTMQRNPSAFDRINVRRLFIVLEKAIALASKSTLFEFNDEFTRATFRNMIEPFLRDVQGRRGIYDFKVVCDETNNTGEVIDTNRFIGDIYIKPARSINFIQLNFVAVRTGVEFNEIIGQ
jgi:phage tail sheath protein FI